MMVLEHGSPFQISISDGVWLAASDAHTIHGTKGRFTYTWMVDFYGFHVGKYTGTIESHGMSFPIIFDNHHF